MRVADWSSFQKALEKKPFVVAIISQEPLERQKGERIALQSHSLEGKPCFVRGDLSVQDLWQKLSASLWEKEPVVVIKECHTLAVALEKVLIEYIQNPGSARLIIEGSKCRKPLLDAVDTSGVVFALADLKPWEKLDRIAEQLVTKQLSLPVAKQLLARTKMDGVIAEQEREKLSIFAEGRAITVKDLDLLVPKDPSESVWQLGGAILQQDRRQAVAIVESLFAEGQAPIGVISLLKMQIKDALLAATVPMPKLQTLVKVRGKRLEKLIYQARNWGEQKCCNALLQLQQTDLALRSTSVDEKLLVMASIARIMQ